VTAAHLKGQTLLPLPQLQPPAGGGEGAAKLTPREQDQVQLLEAACLTWTRQIKQALRGASFESLEGPPPPPARFGNIGAGPCVCQMKHVQCRASSECLEVPPTGGATLKPWTRQMRQAP